LLSWTYLFPQTTIGNLCIRQIDFGEKAATLTEELIKIPYSKLKSNSVQEITLKG
jgi:hypothetical protein